MSMSNQNHVFASPLFAKSLFAGSYPAWPAWIGGLVATWWGAAPFAIRNLVWLMLLDYLCGLFVAGIKGKFDSTEAKRGILRKALMLLVILAGYHMAEPLRLSADVAGIFANAFALAEIASILENASRGGLPIPPWIVARLRWARKMIGSSEAEQPAEKPKRRAAKAGE